jgi:hypothetical protein
MITMFESTRRSRPRRGEGLVIMTAALCLGTVARAPKAIGGLRVMGRQAYGNSGNPREEDDDRHQE